MAAGGRHNREPSPSQTGAGPRSRTHHVSGGVLARVRRAHAARRSHSGRWRRSARDLHLSWCKGSGGDHPHRSVRFWRSRVTTTSPPGRRRGIASRSRAFFWQRLRAVRDQAGWHRRSPC